MDQKKTTLWGSPQQVPVREPHQESHEKEGILSSILGRNVLGGGDNSSTKSGTQSESKENKTPTSTNTREEPQNPKESDQQDQSRERDRASSNPTSESSSSVTNKEESDLSKDTEGSKSGSHAFVTQIKDLVKEGDIEGLKELLKSKASELATLAKEKEEEIRHAIAEKIRELRSKGEEKKADMLKAIGFYKNVEDDKSVEKEQDQEQNREQEQNQDVTRQQDDQVAPKRGFALYLKKVLMFFRFLKQYLLERIARIKQKLRMN